MIKIYLTFLSFFILISINNQINYLKPYFPQFNSSVKCIIHIYILSIKYPLLVF